MKGMKQTRPFTVTLTDAFKKELTRMAKESGYDYGIFFSTSGKAVLERIRPTRQYNYGYRTNVYENRHNNHNG
jgi:hypothetical protein